MDAADREALLDDCAKHRGYFFADVFRKTSALLANERWPFPPSEHVTLSRIVHLLAMRTVAKWHPSMPAGKELIVPHEARYLEYLNAALTLNDAIDRAAKSGAIRLRERSTGVAVPDWHLPSRDRRDSLKRALFDGEHRRAIDFIASSDWLIVPYPHFAPTLTVSLHEFSAWAVTERLASPDEIAQLLTGQPKETPRLGAIAAFSGGRKFDLEAGLYPKQLGGADALENDGLPAIAKPEEQALDVRVKQKAQETAEAIFAESKTWPRMTAVAKRLECLASEAQKSGKRDELFIGQKGYHRFSWFKARLKGWQPEKIGRPKKK